MYYGSDESNVGYSSRTGEQSYGGPSKGFQTFMPTAEPTAYPTRLPTASPTDAPTETVVDRTDAPTAAPTAFPTAEHHEGRDVEILQQYEDEGAMSKHDAGKYNITRQSLRETAAPTGFPTAYPTASPTKAPTAYPTPFPTPFPTPRPTPYPTPYRMPRGMCCLWLGSSYSDSCNWCAGGNEFEWVWNCGTSRVCT
jgi:hypothetical protein